MWTRCTFAALVALSACSIPPDNAFDPETPAEQQAEATLRGVVSGLEGPLAQAEVSVGDAELTTDEDGEFAFTLTPGEITLEVRHAAHLSFVQTLGMSAGEERVLDVTLDPIPQVEGEDAGRIFGVVQRAGQLGLPEAEQDHSGIVVEVEDTGVRVATGTDGAFDLFLAPGTYDLSFSTAGHTAVTADDIEVIAGEAVEVDGPIVLSGIPGTVTGVATLEDGATPDGIAINLVGGGSADTDATGAFSVGDVPAGSYLLTATKDGYEPFTFGFVNVEAGRETVLPGFVLEVSRGVIFGTALLAGQADSSGIGIQLEGQANSAVTGADGAFRLEGVREGTYALRAFKDGFVASTVNGVAVVANSETDVGTITLAPQQGDFTINGGAIFTTDPAVTLELEGDGAVEMRISEDQTFSDAGQGDTDYVTFAQNPGFTLASGDGLKTLFAQLRDADGVEGPLLTATITLDTTPPAVDNFVINGGLAFTNDSGAAVVLTIEASDATSGVGALQLSNDDVLDEPFNNFVAQPSHVLEVVGDPADTANDGLKTVRVRVRDFAGNESATATATITLDRVAPALTAFSVDCDGQTDPLFCPNAIVSLHVESPDAVAMAVSNEAGLPNAIFQPLQTDSAHLLSPGDGARTVFLLLRDAAGNISAEFSDDVTVDSEAPLFPSVSIAAGAPAVNTQTVTVDLTATGATFMRVAFDGVLDDEPTIPFANQATGDLPPNDGEKTVVAVFLDDAGNLSDVARDDILLDRIAPTIDSFTIDDGAAFTNDSGGAVTLRLTASDATSGIVNLQVDNDAVFDGPLEAFVETRAHVVGNPAADGTKTVRIRVLDAAGNFSNEASAQIELDTAPPTLAAPFTVDCDGVTDATDCTSSVVSLSVSSTNAVEMAISNLAGLPDAVFEPIATGVAHLLAPGDGTRTAFLLLRDAAGNVSAEFSDDILVDTAPPNLASLIVNSGAAATNNATVTVDLAATGATQMRVAMDGVLDTEPLEAFANQVTRAVPVGDGAKTVVAVFLDDAGNESVTVSDTITLDTLPPQAPSVIVNNGDLFTTSATVNLALNATGAAEMRIQTDGTFDLEPFVPFASAAPVALIGGDCPAGDTDCREACVIFRDAAGNESAEVCDGITLDGTPPAVPVILTPAQATDSTSFDLVINAEPADAFFGGYEILGTVGNEGNFGAVAPAGTTFGLTLPASAETDPALAAQTTLLRLRAFDQAGNRSAEATLSVTVDTVSPADPVPSVTTATVNADTFAVFFDATNTSDDDATFDRYEISTNGGAFTPTALQDGLIFTLTQGDGVGCVVGTPQTPCVNTLQVKAVDAAGNESASATVTVDEDSTDPTPPRLAPRGASITGVSARIQLEDVSQDNGQPAPTYEIIGGQLGTFTEVAAADFFAFSLAGRRDFSHEICARGKDAAGNVSTADCVVIEQRSNVLIAAGGSEEENPAVFSDVVFFGDRLEGLKAHNLRTDEQFIVDPDGDFAVPDLVQDRDRARVAWVSGGGNGAVMVEVDADDPNNDLDPDAVGGSHCLRACAPNLSNHESLTIGRDENGTEVVIIYGNEGGNQGMYEVPASECLNQAADPGCEVGETGVPGSATRITDANNIQLCQNRDSQPRMENGVLTWCEDNAGTQEIHRFFLATSTEEIIATNIQEPDAIHQPVVTDTTLYWASDTDLCALDHVDAAPGTPFDGCAGTGAEVLDDQSAPVTGVQRLVAGKFGRVGMIVGGGFLSNNAAYFDEGTRTVEQLTDNLLEQTTVNSFADRIAFSDRQRFSQDIVVRELTEGTWVTVHPDLQAKPATDGRFLAWLDARFGTIQMRAIDTVTDLEVEITAPTEFVAVSDSFFGIGEGKGIYGLLDTGTGNVELFLHDLVNNERIGLNGVPVASGGLPIDSGQLDGVAMNHEGTRISWVNNTAGEIRTATVAGLTVVPGSIEVVDNAFNEVRRMSIGGEVIMYADNLGGGVSEVTCFDPTTANPANIVLDPDGRGAGAARLEGGPFDGEVFAAWHSEAPPDSNEIKGCRLVCDGVARECVEITIANSSGGEFALPVVSNSGYVTWRSVTPSDGLGQVALYDINRDIKFKMDTDFDVDGDSPPFDPWVHDDVIIWTSFDFGSSDIFTGNIVE